MEKSRIDLAIEKRKKGYNCSQAVIAPYSDILGVSEEVLFKLSEGFGAGIAASKKTCGALCAIAMIAGMLYSDGNLEEPKTKAVTYQKALELMKKFEEKNGSMMCEDLKGKALRSCNGCILDAVKLIEENFFEGRFEKIELTDF